MNNCVVFAAAGNGKTHSICKEAIALAAESTKYIYLVTYTNEGVRSLEREYKKQNFGVLDQNVVITTWYSFLLSELIRPYQCTLQLKYKYYKQELSATIPQNHIKSIAFYQDDDDIRWYNNRHYQYFFNSARDIRKDNVSNLACRCITDSKGLVISRLESLCSHIFFDELQDYAGWDLEVFLHLFASEIAVKCVGDYKQATFRTNNSPKNKQYRDEGIRNFFVAQQKKGLCSIAYENTTRRFNQEICNYINCIHADPDAVITPADDPDCVQNAENSGVYIVAEEYMETYCNYYTPAILRYQKNSSIPFPHNCYVTNYGNSKGATYDRVVIIPVGTVVPFITSQTKIVKDQTRSKFYVACTRAKHSIVFVLKDPKSNTLFRPVSLQIGEQEIPALKYTQQEE